MNPVGASLMIAGALLALSAGLGMLRFRTPYARFHAAGKASPVAFILVALGAMTELTWDGIILLGVAVAAMILTLPVGVHLLFRATHRTTSGTHLVTDALVGAEAFAADRRRRSTRSVARPSEQGE
ncbi:MAG: monovalent cation/H(+) antiporter subunit G [Acidimicrobiales bacterium]